MYLYTFTMVSFINNVYVGRYCNSKVSSKANAKMFKTLTLWGSFFELTEKNHAFL
jgi:hypothetical protein